MTKFCFKVIAPLTLAAALGFPIAGSAAPAPQATQATQAGNSKADVDLAAKIRRAVVKDKGLSTIAHNVTIVVKDGTATISGQVPSTDQHDAILQKARDIAGANNVVDSMVIAPPK